MCFRIALYIFYEQSRGDFFAGCSFITANSSKLSSLVNSNANETFARPVSCLSTGTDFNCLLCLKKKRRLLIL